MAIHLLKAYPRVIYDLFRILSRKMATGFRQAWSDPLSVLRELTTRDGIVLHLKKLYREVLWDYYSLLGTQHPVKVKIQGNYMYLNVGDPGISRDLFIHHVREEAVTKLLPKIVKRGMIVVNIGANIGYYTLQLAQLVGEEGKVIAIEPEPRNFDLLRKNVVLNGMQNRVELYNVCISDRNGIVRFYLSEKSNTHTIIPTKTHARSILVEGRTIDTFLESYEKIHFIHLDIEGGEYVIKKGLLHILQRFKPSLFIELHPIPYGNSKAVVEFLRDMQNIGYDVSYVCFASAERISIGDLMRDPRVLSGRSVIRTFLKSSNTNDG